MSIDPKQYRSALGTFATGVTIVTTRDAMGNDIGMTANSFNSVSLEPPLILWSLAKTSKSLEAFMTADFFAVHVLAIDQEPLSTRFARRGVDKFANIEVRRGHAGIPLLRDCASVFQCRTAFRHEGGDHIIFVGEVVEFEHSTRAPLVFHGGRYAIAIPAIANNAQSTLEQEQPDSSFSQDFLIYLIGRAHHQLFGQMRREMNRLGLNQDGWQLLSLLGVTNRHTLHDINAMLSYTGTIISYDLLDDLAAKGLIILQGHYDSTLQISLTAAGRSVVIELVAVGKSAGDHAIRNLSDGHRQLLHACLQQVIADTAEAESTASIPDESDAGALRLASGKR
jgi:3-hydroxy-9,10-secoandrosta-1,3,5(10)-triene-9,17-dione monooxygenase reductase component